MFNKFVTGKIYKISDVNNTKCYYGSTINSLSLRKALHKSSYKKYKNGILNKLSVFELFDEFGVENCNIHLVEQYPCTTKNDLLLREGFYIKNHNCVNTSIAGRTLKEYYIDNKDKFKQHNDQYYIQNKEKISQHMKHYYELNKIKIRRKQKLSYNMKVLLKKFKQEELEDEILQNQINNM